MARTTYEEVMLLSVFEQQKQDIVTKIIADYNTSTPQGIRAALNQAAWVGYCKALENVAKVKNAERDV